jgi:branched-chain amino acid transport system permease protein
LQIGAIYVLFSLGLTLVFGVMRVINFAHGEFFALAAILTAICVQTVFPEGPMWLRYAGAFLVALAVVMLLSAIVYVAGLSRFLGDLGSGFIFSLGLVLVLQGLMAEIFGGYPRSVPALAEGRLMLFGGAIALQKVVVAVLALVAAAILLLVVFRTKSGMALRAIAEDREAAMLQGIRYQRLVLYGFILGSSLAAIAGTLIAPLTVILPTMGSEFIMKAFMIVIIGGLGSIWGAIVASFLMAAVESFGSYFIDLPLVTIAVFTLVGVLLVIRPQGLFGHAVR